jgi:hypothetical protein
VELRAGELLQLGEAAGVVVVGVGVQEDLHVLDLEPELLHALADDGHGLHEAAVEEDVSLGRRDQVGGDVVRPHVIEVACDPERLDRLVPRARRGVGLGHRQTGEEKEEEGAKSAHAREDNRAPLGG